MADGSGLAENLHLALGTPINIGARTCAYKVKSGLADASSGVFGQS